MDKTLKDKPGAAFRKQNAAAIMKENYDAPVDPDAYKRFKAMNTNYGTARPNRRCIYDGVEACCSKCKWWRLCVHGESEKEKGNGKVENQQV